MKKAVVFGAGGFIGSHMVKHLRNEGYWVRGVDIKYPEFGESAAHDFKLLDLRSPTHVAMALELPNAMGGSFDELYQFAADMGGAGFVFTGENDADIMHNSALINLYTAEYAVSTGVGKVFYSSSACIYPQHIQEDENNPGLRESDAYPANPDSEYGYEKIFSERLYQAFARNKGLDVRIARYHNIFGPEGTWKGGREKAPAAICRKVIEAGDGGIVEIWGDGNQTRSFLYIDDCIEATRRLMQSDCKDVINIGSDEMVSINQLFQMVALKSGYQSMFLKHVPGPIGVRGRNSNNELILEKLGWAPTSRLVDGISKTYDWIKAQVEHGPYISKTRPRQD